MVSKLNFLENKYTLCVSFFEENNYVVVSKACSIVNDWHVYRVREARGKAYPCQFDDLWPYAFMYTCLHATLFSFCYRQTLFANQKDLWQIDNDRRQLCEGNAWGCFTKAGCICFLSLKGLKSFSYDWKCYASARRSSRVFMQYASHWQNTIIKSAWKAHDLMLHGKLMTGP